MATTSLKNVNGVLHVQGDVTFATVPHLTLQLDKLLTPGVVTLDCGGITHVDSSAIAFLLHGLQVAHQRQISVKITAVSDQIMGLMRLYGVDELCCPQI